MKIYLDTCGLNRLSDRQIQKRIRQETEAVNIMLSNFRTKRWHWISSGILQFEINQNPDLDQRVSLTTLLQLRHQIVFVGGEEILRGEELVRYLPYLVNHFGEGIGTEEVKESLQKNQMYDFPWHGNINLGKAAKFLNFLHIECGCLLQHDATGALIKTIINNAAYTPKRTTILPNTKRARTFHRMV